MRQVTSPEGLPLHSTRLRERRQARDWSYAEAAARLRGLSRELSDETEVGTTAQRVWRWEHGEYPQARHRRLLCRLYGASSERLGFRAVEGAALVGAPFDAADEDQALKEGDPREVTRTSAVESGAADISREMAAMAAFRAADRRVGGGHMYATVAAYLRTEIAPRVFRVGPERDGIPLFNAAAALTEMTGWMAFDAGRNALADRYFGRALVLARAGDDLQLMAHVLAGMSHMAHKLNEPDKAINLAREAQATAKAGPHSPQLNALLAAREACGFAALGQSRDCARLLLRAETLLAAAAAEPSSPWISRFDEASLAGETATCMYQLGDMATARRQADRVLALRDDGRARSRAFGELVIAAVLVEQGAADEACVVGRNVLEATEGLGSFRVLQHLEELRRGLERYRATPPVADFLVRLDAAISERGWLPAWNADGTHEGLP